MSTTHPPTLVQTDGSGVEQSPLEPSRGVSLALATLFFLASRAPWVLRLIRPLAVMLTVFASGTVRRATAANGRRIFGQDLSFTERFVFAMRVVGNFYDFVVDAGRSATATADELAGRIDMVVGEPAFLASRQSGKGAVMVTAHMGAFEVGLAALKRVERSVHVVFKRDPFSGFEAIRTRVRHVLDVHEAAIDDGFPSLVRLRDALRNDEVVVIQADRAMPGQRSVAVPVLEGHVRLPSGPVKLAQLTESPIVPVFVVRKPKGKFDVHLCEPILIDPTDVEDTDGIHPAHRKIAAAIETFVRKYPEQWLVLDFAFVEDEQLKH